MAARLARRVDRLSAREGVVDPVRVTTDPPPWLRTQLATFRQRFLLLRTPLPQVALPGLASIHYEHPDDRAALDALRAVPGFDRVLGFFIDYYVRQIEMDLLLNSVEVTAVGMPELDRALAKACEVLDVEKPRLYVTEGSPPVKNAYTTGVDRPIIVLYERLVETLSFDELVFVIGHELGHGFDDQGSKYDGDGALISWWTEDDRAAFEERTKILIEQYDALTPDGLSDEFKVNGALTIGENIGDLGGITIAYKAYLMSLGGKEPEVIDGLTGAQRFFLSWGLIWRGKSRDEIAIQRLATDPHSPSEFRCNQVARNFDSFYEAFEVTDKDAMWLEPAKRVAIW
jgi:hypothetical protein